MKNITLLLFLILSFQSSAQIIQAWDLSPLGQKTYFERDNGFLEMYYNDSTEVFADYRKHYFGEKYYKQGFGDCYNEVIPFIEIIDENFSSDFPIDEWLSNENYFYSFLNSDTIKFYHQAAINFTWQIPTFNTNVNYTHLQFECTDIIEKEVLGELDSVRIYELTTLENGVSSSSNLTGITFELSKQFGWIKFIPIHKLINPNLSFNEEVFNISGWKKNGITKGLDPFFNLFYTEHLVGDIYKRKQEYYNTFSTNDWFFAETWMRDSITEVTVYPDSLVELSYERTRLYLYEGYDGMDTLFTITTNNSLKHWKYGYSVDPNIPPNFYFSSNNQIEKLDKLKVNASNQLTVEVIYQDIYLDDNCFADFQLDNGVTRIYNSELGLTYFKNWGLISTIEESLIGYKRGDLIEGDISLLAPPLPTSNRPPTIDISKIEVYPNPTTDYLNFKIPNLQPLDIFIYNSTGKLVFEKHHFDSNSLDISELEKGFYLLKVVNEEIHFSQKVIKN